MSRGDTDGGSAEPVGGEFVSIPERVVVSPAWGRLQAEPLEEGRNVTRGMLLGRIRLGMEEVLLVAPVAGVFLSWLAREGERITPGRPLARLLPVEDGVEEEDGGAAQAI